MLTPRVSRDENTSSPIRDERGIATGYAPPEGPEPPPSPRLDVTDLFFEDRFGARPAAS